MSRAPKHTAESIARSVCDQLVQKLGADRAMDYGQIAIIEATIIEELNSVWPKRKAQPKKGAE